MVIIDFLIYPLILIELIITGFISSLKLNKREFFKIRFFSFSIIALLLIILFEVTYFLFTKQTINFYLLDNNTLNSDLRLIISLLVIVFYVIIFTFSYKDHFKNLIFYLVKGFLKYFIIFNIFRLIITLLFSKISAETYYFLIIVVNLILFFILIFIQYLFLKMKMDFLIIDDLKVIDNKIYYVLSLVGIQIILESLICFIPELSLLSSCIIYLLNITLSFSLLFILYYLSKDQRNKYQLQLLQEIIHKEKEQYDLSKENVELLNVKFHDLKHQINLIKEKDEKNFDEINKALNIYDSIVKTGNDVLDVILTEKSLICEKEGITFNIMADAKDLDFIENSDLYSIFGNALSNSIEALIGEQEKSKKTIKLNIFKQNGFLKIRVTNYYVIEPKFDKNSNLPLTFKDKKYHGFGMKSIKRCVEKYHGVLSCKIKNQIFILSILIPLPENKSSN